MKHAAGARHPVKNVLRVSSSITQHPELRLNRIPSLSCATTAISEILSLVVVADWHTSCSTLQLTNTHVQKHTYGKKLVRLGRRSADSASFEWSHGDLAWVCALGFFCVLALACIQLVPPLLLWRETKQGSTTYHAPPKWPTAWELQRNTHTP